MIYRLAFLAFLFPGNCFLFAQNTSYTIQNVTVIPMNREVALPNQTVLVENGIISKMGDASAMKIPKNVARIDGTGKYLMPGLFDMHAHFFYEQGDNKNTCREELKMMLANGLTTVRIECGDSVYLDARKKVKDGEWVGPQLYVASPQFVGAWPWPGKVFASICTTPQEAETAVRKHKAEGYDEIKITFMVKRDVYDAIIKTAKEEGIKVTGHVGPLVKLPAALAARQQIEHMDEFIDMLLPDTSYNHGQSVSDMNIWRKKAWATVPYLDESKIPALVKMVKDAGIYVTTTNFFFFSSFGEGMSDEEYKQRPDYQYIPSNIKQDRWNIKERYWNNAPPEESRKKYVWLRKKMTYELWKAGVPLMAGSDSPEWFLTQGFSIHDELETFVKAGLTPFAALQTATVNTAAYLGVSQNKGTIEVGKQADLILLDQNPLEDIRHTRSIHAVFQGKKRYDAKAVKQLLQEARVLGE
ncbi:MAG TPA: amidohydrolase family protein [Saprospiraceae bacterium]|nr:amidohydrolase family protein [Saprospiraceae bacterium]